MATKEIERKIAVIFATDVVGYSKSIEINEEKTIKSLRACKKILEDLFKEHDGRIFNTAGDSVLAEFSSAVSAVICATEFQKLIKQRNESETTDLKMEFRIGINMGDVVVEVVGVAAPRHHPRAAQLETPRHRVRAAAAGGPRLPETVPRGAADVVDRLQKDLTTLASASV